MPQGFVVGPLTLLAFINHLLQNIRSRVRLYADDTILCLTITSEDNCRQLQDDLDALQKWEATWRMEFDDTKCCGSRGLKRHSNIVITCMALQYRRMITRNTCRYTVLKRSQVESTIDEITAKANRTLGFLKRNLQVNSSTSKDKAYKG